MLLGVIIIVGKLSDEGVLFTGKSLGVLKLEIPNRSPFFWISIVDFR